MYSILIGKSSQRQGRDLQYCHGSVHAYRIQMFINNTCLFNNNEEGVMLTQ